MQVNIVVCGRFHYLHYLSDLYREIPDLFVYFSHKKTESLGLPDKNRLNLPIKEYLAQGVPRILRGRFRDSSISLSHRVWTYQLAKVFRPANVNLFMLHGNCGKAIRAAKTAGMLTVGEAVNSHPRTVDERLAREAQKVGLPTPRTRNSREIEQEAFEVDYLLCPSASVAKSFTDNGIHPRNIRTIPYGMATIDRPLDQHRMWHAGSGRSNAQYQILCVAEVSLRKAQHLILEALDSVGWQICGRKCTLTLIGSADPPYLRYLRNLSPEIIYIDHLPHDLILDAMRGADCVALTSIEDGFGMVVGEALSQGTPVIVSEFAGASEVVRNHPLARVVNPLSTASVVAALEQLGLPNADQQVDWKLRLWRDYAQNLAAFLRDIEYCRTVGHMPK